MHTAGESVCFKFVIGIPVSLWWGIQICSCKDKLVMLKNPVFIVNIMQLLQEIIVLTEKLTNEKWECFIVINKDMKKQTWNVSTKWFAKKINGNVLTQLDIKMNQSLKVQPYDLKQHNSMTFNV